MATKSRSKVRRDFAEMSDGTRYSTATKTGGWVRLSTKRHEEKDLHGVRKNRSARRRQAKLVS